MITINGRFLTQRTTGSQRYAHEVTQRLIHMLGTDRIQVFMPRSKEPVSEEFAAVTKQIGRLQGHPWEQLELGRLANRSGGVLWSPVNVGPLNAKRHVVTIHDLFAIQYPEWVGRRFHLWYSFLLPKLASSAQHIITDSEYSKAMIVEELKVPEDKVSVIHLATDTRFAVAGQDEVSLLREKYKLPQSFILSLGSLEPRKNLQRVVDAWRRLDQQNRPPLVIAGGLGSQKVFGSYEVDVLRQHKDIVLLGYVPEEDLPALYSAATVFVYASLLEGFGLPPLEAMACGTPVISSNTSSLPEVVGDAAVGVDPHDIEAMTESMQRVLTDREYRMKMRAKGLERSKQFSWDKTSEKVLQVLKAVAGN